MAVSSVYVWNSSDSLCVDSKKYNKKEIPSERERVGCRCKSKDYNDTGRGNQNTIWMDDLTKCTLPHMRRVERTQVEAKGGGARDPSRAFWGDGECEGEQRQEVRRKI